MLSEGDQIPVNIILSLSEIIDIIWKKVPVAVEGEGGDVWPLAGERHHLLAVVGGVDEGHAGAGRVEQRVRPREVHPAIVDPGPHAEQERGSDAEIFSVENIYTFSQDI